MDDASIHSSESSTEIFKKLNLCIMYLPAYSPELEAIESFFRLIKKQNKKQQICKRVFILKSKRKIDNF